MAPLKWIRSSSFSVPDEMLIVLDPAVPPLLISTTPPLSLAPTRLPPEDTNSRPPDRTVPLATPPRSTVWLPPLDTVTLTAVPPDDTTTLPPPDTTVALALPPEDTNSLPPADTTVARAVPLAITVSLPPLRTMTALSMPRQDQYLAAVRDRHAAGRAAGRYPQGAATDQRTARHATRRHVLDATCRHHGRSGHAPEDTNSRRLTEPCCWPRRPEHGLAAATRHGDPAVPPDDTTSLPPDDTMVARACRPRTRSRCHRTAQ